MKSKIISRLPGVTSEGTHAVYAFLLVPKPVPKRKTRGLNENIELVSRACPMPLTTSSAFAAFPPKCTTTEKPSAVNVLRCPYRCHRCAGYDCCSCLVHCGTGGIPVWFLLVESGQHGDVNHSRRRDIRSMRNASKNQMWITLQVLTM